MSELYRHEVAARLQERAGAAAEAYRTADPFPHAVFDDLLPREPLERAADAFPVPGSLEWQSFDNPREKKLAFNRVDEVPDPIRDVLHFMNSATMLLFLERLTGIECLVPDPYFAGGGLHQIERGGRLGIHADFNRYERLRLDRRLNLLLYLNRDWPEEYGGHLELWDASMQRCVRRVLPAFNRCVVFSTSDLSFHGHPEPLSCPPDRTRRSFATYYYTNGRPAEELGASHSTLFRERPGERATFAQRAARGAQSAVRAVTPPILLAAIRRLRRRSSE